jgi:hypothetical protein
MYLPRYHAIKSPLESKYSLFWKLISDVWCEKKRFQPQNHSLSPDQNSSFDFFSSTFSPSTGLYIFIDGVTYPHWPTVDTIEEHIIPRKYLEVPREHQLGSSGNSLPCVPFYNLSLQDRKWIIRHNSSASLIDICDTMGWNGTGSIRFHSSSLEFGSQIERSYLEIPFQLRWDPSNQAKLQLTYCPTSNSFEMPINISLVIETFNSDKFPILIFKTQTYRIKWNGQTDVTVTCESENEVKTIHSDNWINSTSETKQQYCWCDEHSIPCNSREEYPWTTTSFSLSFPNDTSLPSIESVKIIDCQISVECLPSDIQTETEVLLGSFTACTVPNLPMVQVVSSSHFKIRHQLSVSDIIFEKQSNR